VIPLPPARSIYQSGCSFNLTALADLPTFSAATGGIPNPTEPLPISDHSVSRALDVNREQVELRLFRLESDLLMKRLTVETPLFQIPDLQTTSIQLKPSLLPCRSETVLCTVHRGSRRRSSALRDCHIIPR